MPGDETDPLRKAQLSALTQPLAGLGWTDGRSVRIDLRWGGDDINRTRALAQELVGLQPDIILTGRDSGGRCPPAGDVEDPDRLCERERPRRKQHRRTAQ